MQSLKTGLFVIFLAFSPPLIAASAAITDDGDILDIELISLASQTDSTAFIANPATLHKDATTHHFMLNSAGGNYFNDADELLDDFDESDKEGERIRAKAEQGPLTPNDFDRQIELFEQMDGKLFTLAGGSTFAISLPIDLVETTLIASISGRLATSFSYAEEDAARLRTAPLLGIVFPPDLESRVIIQGIAVSDVGLNFSGNISILGNTRIGLTVKYQGIRLLEKHLEVDEYEDVELNDFRDNIDINHRVNFDIGLYKSWGRWHASLAASELNGKTFTSDLGTKYHLRPGLQAGLAYQGRFGILSADMDIVPSQRAFGLLDDEQRLRLGSQFFIGEHWQLGAGFQHVIKGRDSDAATIAMAYKFDNGGKISTALIFAGEREIGTALQFQLPFWKI